MRFVAVRSVENQARADAPSRARTAGRATARGCSTRCAAIWPRSASWRRRGRSTPMGSSACVADGSPDDGEIVVPDCVREALPTAGRADRCADAAIRAIDDEIAAAVKTDEKARRLMTIPGVGPITASAILATVKDMSAFSERARVRGLSRPDAALAFERGQGASRAHHETGRPIFAQAAGRGRLRPAIRHREGHNDALRFCSHQSAAGAQVGRLQGQADGGRARQQADAHRLRACSRAAASYDYPAHRGLRKGLPEKRFRRKPRGSDDLRGEGDQRGDVNQRNGSEARCTVGAGSSAIR